MRTCIIERESERDFDGGEMGFFDASYGASEDEDEDEEEKNATIKATFTQTTTTTAKTTSTLPNPETFLEEKQCDDFLLKSSDHFGRNDDDDDDETTRKRRDAHTIRRDAKMVVKKRIEWKTEEEEHGATTTFCEEVTKATKAKRPKEKRQVEGGVKERERKKRQAGQNGRDTTEWKTEAEMVLRQQYD